MRRFCPTTISAALACAAILPATVLADDPPASIDISALPASIVDDVVVPVPREIFLSLDKLGDQDWSSQVTDNKFDKLGDREQIALLFGVVVAEGFVAVQAEDREAVIETGRHVSRLAKALGVSDSVTAHAAAIIDAAQVDDWDEVRTELDRVQESVRAKMHATRDDLLAQMVSAGGWLRGTEAIAALIGSGYSAERAEILHQPDLAEHIAKQLSGGSKSALNTALVKGLGTIQPLLAKPGGKVGKAEVVKISSTCSDLVGRITSNAK